MSVGGPNPTKLYDLAKELLEACTVVYAENDLEPPPLRYVCATSNPVPISDSLVVSYSRLFHGMPAKPDQPYPSRGLMVPRSASFGIWIFRSLEDTLWGEGQVELSLVDLGSVDRDAKLMMTDAYLLPKGIVAAHAAGQLGVDSGQPVGMGDVLPLPASGGVGGLRLEISFELV